MKNANYTNSNVKYLRIKREIAQSKLAEDLEIDQSTLAKWENGSRQITLDWAIKISNYFNIDVGTFIATDLKRNISSEMPSSDEYKKILKDKGLMDENDFINKEKLENLLQIADMMKNFNDKKKD